MLPLTEPGQEGTMSPSPLGGLSVEHIGDALAKEAVELSSDALVKEAEVSGDALAKEAVAWSWEASPEKRVELPYCKNSVPWKDLRAVGVCLDEDMIVIKVEQGSLANQEGVCVGWRLECVGEAAVRTAAQASQELNKRVRQKQGALLLFRVDEAAARQMWDCEITRIQALQRGVVGRQCASSHKALQLRQAGLGVVLQSLVVPTTSYELATIQQLCLVALASRQLSQAAAAAILLESEKPTAPAWWAPSDIAQVGLSHIGMVCRSWISAGKTPILIDRTAGKKNGVDELLLEKEGALVVSGKKMDLALYKGGADKLLEILEEARKHVTAALNQGNMLVIACENSQPDFKKTLSDSAAGLVPSGGLACLPLELFLRGGQHMRSPWPERLARDSDDVMPRFAGMAPGFGVCVSCKLKPDLFEKQLFRGARGLPWMKQQYHPLIVTDSSQAPPTTTCAALPSGNRSVLATDGPEFCLSVRAPESCSCLEGNPCVDAYGCKDWHNRFDVATKHGWHPERA
eukprot:TRINITY_DN10922_c0_g1_i3.p1 TRINITY_DN10922_c0_g1~~TRINITY_DN10922_c0_g1_i3.p1  ORF type:complete len:517 (+),score=98.74 TRINITY_DN10922_c0_g1_i3:354-1904(+)